MFCSFHAGDSIIYKVRDALRFVFWSEKTQTRNVKDNANEPYEEHNASAMQLSCKAVGQTAAALTC